MIILQWIVWGLLAAIAVAWTFGVFYSRRQGSVSKAMVSNVTVFWLLLMWTLFAPGLNKLHLLWLAPPIILLSNFLPTVALVFIYAVILYFLS